MKIFKYLFYQYKGLPKEIYVLFFCKIVNNLGNFVYPLLSLILTQKVGISKDETGLFITCLSLMCAPGLLLGGKLIDTIGRKKVILIFQFLSSIVFIICGFTKPSLKLTYILMLASVFSAFCMPAFDALTADLTTPDNRKEAFSLIYMGHNLGFSIGPVIGGLLFKNHLSLVFIGDAITTLISMTILYVFVKETINKKEPISNDLTRTLEKSQPGSVFNVLKHRPILIFYAFVMFFFNFGYAQFGFALPLQLGDLYKDGAKFYGFLAAFNGFIVICLTPLISKLSHGLKSTKTMAFGGLLYSLSFLLFSYANTLILFFLGVFILTIGEIIILINAAFFVANHSPASHRGRINAILPMIYGLGYSLSPMIVGKLLALYSMKICWILVAFIVFIASIFMNSLKSPIEKNYR